ncbi:MAG: inner membrane CreD family protein [Kiritimatiellia bacterium]|jgi:hypothetical protein|nr:inner membrane CreD family protein [Kiritimatiellia bacterium]MDP6811545.1 inner membrane CreD family protein [Kiritimatiellia bacterium]MDP7025200.1 inner membrane CreD family protein [Kiritimatiellia bacterium]
MSLKRIVMVGVIFAIACGAWWILGTATAVRSASRFGKLGPQVENLWGDPLVQKAPSVSVETVRSAQRWMMPQKNDITVRLETDYRKKGLIWYPTYTCAFDGTYTIANTEAIAQKIRIHFDFPAQGATYDNFAISVDGASVLAPIDTAKGIDETVELGPGESAEFRVTYRTRGIRDWRYKMDPNVGRVQNLNLVLQAGFDDIDYTGGSLSPMSIVKTDDGVDVAWIASDLITSEDIGVVIPEKLNPGPLTSRITFFAPVCLLFFFMLVGTINIIYGVNIHPMHYLFVAAGFFAFHLLLSYMAGLVNIHLSFIIAATTSVVLVTTYLSAALGGKFPWKVAIAGQLFFLVLFSYSFFLKGITGLTVAIGSVVTLAIMMRVTARLDWDDVFSRPTRSERQRPDTPPAPPPPPPMAPENGLQVPAV